MRFRLDVISILIIGIMIIVGFQYYYNKEYRECISNPLGYSVKYFEERWTGNFEGTATMRGGGNAPIYIFNRSGVFMVRQDEVNFSKVNISLEDLNISSG